MKSGFIELKNTILFYTLVPAAMLLWHSCDKEPGPEEEEEVITTLTVTLVPQGAGDPVTLKFYDQDGIGAIEPTQTTSGPLAAHTVYEAALALFNESETPPANIIEEIEEEKGDHIFCYTPQHVNITIDDFNKDSNNMNVGITSRWTTGEASSGTVQIALRHQPGTKTGDCPGSGSTDIDVTFQVEIK